LQLFAQQHNELEVQNFELFIQILHSFGLLDNKEVKQICTLIPFPPFLTCSFLTYWVFVVLLESKHRNHVARLNLLILAHNSLSRLIFLIPSCKLNLWVCIFNLTFYSLGVCCRLLVCLYASPICSSRGIIDAT
jgi:hypothetical protein